MFSRFGSNSPPPGVHSQTHFPNSANSGGNSATTPDNSDFNPTAAYLWLLSQQQQHLPNAAAAAAALNLTSRNAVANSFLNGGSTNNSSTNNGSPKLSLNSSTTNTHASSKDAALETDKPSNISPAKEKNAKNHSVAATVDELHKSSNGTLPNGTSQVNSSLSRKRIKNDEEEVEDSTDDEDEDDDMESNNSSNQSQNPVSSTGFNGMCRRVT